MIHVHPSTAPASRRSSIHLRRQESLSSPQCVLNLPNIFTASVLNVTIYTAHTNGCCDENISSHVCKYSTSRLKFEKSKELSLIFFEFFSFFYFQNFPLEFYFQPFELRIPHVLCVD
eukprot:Trichotokara_eunicae@DN182_c0_g1_i1.p1